MKKNYIYIYKITNLQTNKVYIGRRSFHKPIDYNYWGGGKWIRQSIMKRGLNNFKRDIIEYVDSLEEAYIREQYWINFYKSNNPKFGYNITKGGQDGGSQKGRIFSKETIENFSKAQKDRIVIHKENIQTRIKRDELNKFLNEGWSLGQTFENREKARLNSLKGASKIKNSTFTQDHKNKIKNSYINKTWVTDGVHEKHVDNNLIDEFLNNNKNWYKGKRKNKFQSDEKKKKLSIFRKGKITVYKEGIIKVISKEELNFYISKGWQKKSPYNKDRAKRISLIHKGRRSINNGIIEKQVVNYEDFLKLGWKLGGLKRSK